MMQPRFDKRSGSTPYSLVDQARFRAAFDFMRLRADCGEVSEAIAEWWQEFSTGDDLRKQDLLEQVREEHKGKGRVHVRAPAKAARAPREAADAAASGTDDEAPQEEIVVEASGETGAPRKRRRRRKPRTGGGGASGGAPDGE